MIKKYRAKAHLSTVEKNHLCSMNEMSMQAVQCHQEGINKALEELISFSGLVDGEEAGSYTGDGVAEGVH